MLLLCVNQIFIDDFYVTHRKQRKLDKQFEIALQEYLDAARSGTLNIDILNTLISSVEAIEKNIRKKLLTGNNKPDTPKRMHQFILLNQHSLNTPLMQEIAPSNDGKIEY